MILITGATGLLGSELMRRLSADGLSVAALCRREDQPLPPGIERRIGDITNQPSLRDAMEGITTVVHAAAMVSFNPARKHELMEVNVEGTRNVVNTCLQMGVKRLLHISSVSALDKKGGSIITEESQWQEDGSSPYGHSKYLAELEVYRGMEEGLDVSIVNPSIILSGDRPGQSSDGLFDYVWQERPFFVDGMINYVDVRDVAEAVAQLYHTPRPGEKFILVAGEVRLQEWLEQVARRLGKKPPRIKVGGGLLQLAGWLEEWRARLRGKEPTITRLSARLATQVHHYSNEKARQKLGIQFRSLEESLDWCCDRYSGHVKAYKR